MTRRMRSLGLASAALALTMTIAACGDDTPEPGTTGPAISGQVVIDGSSTVFPFADAAAELFEEEYPDAEVNVASSGTGGGFEKFCRGETDVSDASRHIEQDEIDACTEAGIAFEEITVANDALTVMVHPSNPVNCLTVAQLQAIWGADSTLTNWNQIPGITYDAPLDLFGPGTDSGTFDFFTAAINGTEGEQRTEYNNIGENDNVGLTGVQNSPGAMFYVGYTYFAENQSTVKALQIDGGSGCVAPSPTSATDGTYTPLSRGLFMYGSDAGIAKSQVRAFFEFVINNNDEIAGVAKAIPLTAAQKTEMLAKVASLAG